ncbi:MAG: hypothetical protein AB1467_05965 [Candidatus Diapherotrites archaeon]
MKSKGFTLFTALVSFVLIVLSILLVQGMINAERARIDTITAIEEQAKMQEIADHERNDALQLLVYDIRFELEDYFNREDKIGPLCYNCSFDELVQQFAESKFGACSREMPAEECNRTGGEQLANFVAATLYGQLSSTKTIGSYYIKTDLGDETELKSSLKNLINKSAGQGSFFKVIECENGDPKNCTGTFYLSLRVGDLSNEEYEKLPRISVTNTQTGRVLQVAVLPRSNFQIYVPLRFFKAVAEARALVMEYDKEDSGSWSSNMGLFSPRIHNELEELKLGMCDKDICNYRTNPYKPPDSETMSTAWCPNELAPPPLDQSINCDSLLFSLGFCDGRITKYNPSKKKDIEDAVIELTKKRLYNLIDNKLNIYLNNDPNFKYVGSEITPAVEVKNSKIIFSSGSLASVSGNKDWSYRDPCSYTNTGVWLENNKIKGEKISGECEGDQSGTLGHGFCGELSSIDVVFKFNELNPLYAVNKKKPEHKYSIWFEDNLYSSFTAKYERKATNSDCALNGEPQPISGGCNYVAGWSCFVEIPMSGSYEGCQPKAP